MFFSILLKENLSLGEYLLVKENIVKLKGKKMSFRKPLVNRALYSRRFLESDSLADDYRNFSCVQIGVDNVGCLRGDKNLLIWNYASVSKNRKGVWQFNVPVEFLIHFDYRNIEIAGRKIVFAGSLFGPNGHCFAFFDWNDLVDKVLIPKEGSINFVVARRGKARKFIVKTRKQRIVCLNQSDWLKIRRKRKFVLK
jgi:hypothetical protein